MILVRLPPEGLPGVGTAVGRSGRDASRAVVRRSRRAAVLVDYFIGPVTIASRKPGSTSAPVERGAGLSAERCRGTTRTTVEEGRIVVATLVGPLVADGELVGDRKQRPLVFGQQLGLE